MTPTTCTIDGRPGRVKRIRTRDDGSVVAHVRLDDGPLLIVDAALVTGRTTESEAHDEDQGQAEGDA